MPGDTWRRFANLRAYLAFMWAHPGKQLLFMGCELGQEAEWSHERSIDWESSWPTPTTQACQALVGDLNRVYRPSAGPVAAGQRAPRGSPGSTPTTSDHNALTFIRWAPDERGRWSACATSRRCRAATTGSACPRSGAGSRC